MTLSRRPSAMAPPSRLRVNGRELLNPDGSVAALRGFNLVYMLDTEFEVPHEPTDGMMMTLLPNTNIVRLVMLHWDDAPTETKGAAASARGPRTCLPRAPPSLRFRRCWLACQRARPTRLRACRQDGLVQRLHGGQRRPAHLGALPAAV